MLLVWLPIAAKPIEWYLERETSFLENVPTPQQVFGFEVGVRHLMPEQLDDFGRRLAASSDRVIYREIGRTHEFRPLFHLIISHPDNLGKLETLRREHITYADPNSDPQRKAEDMPVVVWMGFSVHGDETSGANAAAVLAYYLAAAQDIDPMLRDMIIILEPTLNPDGLARYTQWVNSFGGKVPIADRNHIEHHEGWPSGRYNHYGFDLNRDWLLLQHPESRARITVFQEWLPHIFTDHHEMGSQSTFFFQPGVPTRRNPWTPESNERLTREITETHAEFFDKAGRLYFSEQLFDDFYYGKGSTYPDPQGSIGILFEQAYSNGRQIQRDLGILKFEDTVQNQVRAGMATLSAAHTGKTKLIHYQRNFIKEALEKAAADPIGAYVFDADFDPYRAWKMAQTLSAHGIKVHALKPRQRGPAASFKSGWVVPVNQSKYYLIKSLFETGTTFEETVFYDVSAFHFPSAHGLKYEAVNGDPAALLGEIWDGQQNLGASFQPSQTAYAYLVDWRDYGAPEIAYRIMAEGGVVLGASRGFRSADREFCPGSLVIPTGPVQGLERRKLEAILAEGATKRGVRILAVDRGRQTGRPDLGGPNFRPLRLPKVLMLVGEGVSARAAGELWHLLDVAFEMPVVLVDADRFNRMKLHEYSHIVFADGSFSAVNDSTVNKLKTWLHEGGCVIGIADALSWLQRMKITTFDLQTPNAKTLITKDAGEEIPITYEDISRLTSEHVVGGAVLEVELDPTHPLAFGMPEKAAVLRRGTHILTPDENPFANPGLYSKQPLISGWVSGPLKESLAGSGALTAREEGSGQVLLFSDRPAFRGFWMGTHKLFLNALFYNHFINYPSGF